MTRLQKIWQHRLKRIEKELHIFQLPEPPVTRSRKVALVTDDSTYVLRTYDHGQAILHPGREQAPFNERSGEANSIPHNY